MVLFKMAKPDSWIRAMCAPTDGAAMIEPFAGTLKQEGVISSGVSSYGYDMRLHDEFRVFSPSDGHVMDPKNFRDEAYATVRAKVCEIPPNSYVLARSLEYFRIPRDVLAICFGKSTYARCGVIVNVTPLEPEWEGYVTISISNTSPVPARIYAGEGVAQVVFLDAHELCETSYADRAGKYQAQKEITAPRMMGESA